MHSSPRGIYERRFIYVKSSVLATDFHQSDSLLVSSFLQQYACGLSSRCFQCRNILGTAVTFIVQRSDPFLHERCEASGMYPLSRIFETRILARTTTPRSKAEEEENNVGLSLLKIRETLFRYCRSDPTMLPAR
jgi:hypothetical protein